MNILTAPGKKLFLSGDEAVARAALEKRVDVVTGYPGNPSAKVITGLLPISKQYEIVVEWSTNEKVALEVASGAAWAGRRSLVTMKMSGINVMADSLLSISHSGVTGALVIYAVDDVGVYYGMVEQDSRYYAMLASIPLLMPSTPEEAYAMTLRAFQVSEQTGAPVFILSTTAVADAITAIRVGQIEQSRKPAARFSRNPAKFTKVTSQWCREQHHDALKRLELAGELFRSCPEINCISLLLKDVTPRIGLIAAGVSYAYVQDVFQRFPTYSKQLALFKLGSVYPLPQAELHNFLLHVDVVLVLEELEPIIETHILALLTEADLQVEMLGKRNGLLPRIGNYTLELVEKALKVVIEHGSSAILSEISETNSNEEGSSIIALPRTPEFCPGCPHRMTYYALQRAIERLGFEGDEVIVTGDVGCTIVGVHSPLDVCWTEVSMGASIGIAQGLKYAGIDKPVVAAMGDGTFYHNGIAGLLNAVQSGMNLTLLILDNSTSAMTGLQPDAGSGKRANGEPSVRADIAMIARGCGVTHVEEVNPYDLPRMIEKLQQAITHPNVAVVIAKAPCTTQGVLINERVVQVNQDICLAGTECQHTPCYSQVGCPSVLLHKDDGKLRITIDSSTCVSCGLCVTACPFGAISPLFKD